MSALDEDEGTLPSAAICRLFKDEDVIMVLASVLFDHTDGHDVDVDWSSLKESDHQYYAGVVESVLGELLAHVDKFVKTSPAGPTTA